MRVQEALFREDLVWLKRGYTERQLDLIVFLALALSLDQADDRLAVLCSSSENRDGWEMKRRTARIDLYRIQARTVLERLSTRLLNLDDHELTFFF